MTPHSIRLLIAVAVLAGGCSVQQPYERPPVDLPAAWQGAKTVPQAEPGQPGAAWWRTFEDAALDGLLETVLASNHDLRATERRIAQARAQARAANAERYPAITGGLGAERTRPFSGGTSVSKFVAEANIGFEPDVWDKFGSLARAADAGVDAAAESGRVIRLTLLADAAGTYFEIAALTQRLDLARRSLAVAERIDGIVETRYRNGAVSGLDRAQSKASLTNIRASVPPLEQALAQAQFTLALLAGRQPGALSLAPARLTEVPMPAALPLGLPSEILLRRPDIRFAEANLRAAHADVGVARANLYPSLLLTTDAGFASSQLSNLLRGSSGFLTIGANLLAPIFQAGRLQALADRAAERHAELVQTYHQTILGALREVESALVGVEKLAQQDAAQQETIEHARSAFGLAEVRYQAGLVDALTLLTTQTALINAEDSFLRTRFARIGTIVSLYRALGGGW